MSKGLNIHDGLGMIAKDPDKGQLIGYGSSVPANGTPGWAPGAVFIKTNGNTIGTVQYINIGTKASAAFVQPQVGAPVIASFVFGDATPIDTPFFIAPSDRNFILQSVVCRLSVAGTDPSAVTAEVRKAASGTAISAGTLVHTGTLNLKGTVDANQTLTLSATTSVKTVSAGWSLGLDVTGTTTAARGVITAVLLPA